MKSSTLRYKAHRWLAAFLLVVYGSVMTHQVSAEPVSRDYVKAAVTTWVRYVTAEARPTASIERMDPYVVDGDTSAWVAHLSDSGFCLCSADDIGLPVYYYSPGGRFDMEDPDGEPLLCSIASRIRDFKERLEAGDPDAVSKLGAMQEREQYWQDLSSGIVPEVPVRDTRGVPSSMKLPLTNRWHQGPPYNDLCPALSVLPGSACNPRKTVVGCVATAMSQAMYYWQWPQRGEGQGSTEYEFWRSAIWISEPLSFDPGILDSYFRRCDILKYEEPAPGNGLLMMKGYWDRSLYEYAWKKDCVRIDLTQDELEEYRRVLEALFSRLPYHSSLPQDADFGATTYRWDLMEDSHAPSVTDPPCPGNQAVAELCYHSGISLGMDYGVHGSSAHTSDVPTALVNHFRYDRDASLSEQDELALLEEIRWLRPVVMEDGGCGHSSVAFGYKIGADIEIWINTGYDRSDNPMLVILDEQCHGEHRQMQLIAPRDVVKFIGASTPGGDGSPADPYENIEVAKDAYPDGATLIFKAGSDNTFSGSSLVLERPCVLKGYQSVIRKE